MNYGIGFGILVLILFALLGYLVGWISGLVESPIRESEIFQTPDKTGCENGICPPPPEFLMKGGDNDGTGF